jgi:hypothetical protein
VCVIQWCEHENLNYLDVRIESVCEYSCAHTDMKAGYLQANLKLKRQRDSDEGLD